MELHSLVAVEVLVHGVMLDLTLNLLGHQVLARLRIPLWSPIDHHHRTGFGPTNRLQITNKGTRLATSGQLGQ
jgi:hypothetical protein